MQCIIVHIVHVMHSYVLLYTIMHFNLVQIFHRPFWTNRYQLQTQYTISQIMDIVKKYVITHVMNCYAYYLQWCANYALLSTNYVFSVHNVHNYAELCIIMQNST